MTRIFVLLLALFGADFASGAQQIGRLFFTPAEREQLDVARMQKRAPEGPAAQPAEPRPSTQTITYSGIVRRSDGKAILWLNNKPADEKHALSDLALSGRVRPDGAVTLRVPETGGSINLKVGQRAELQTGRIAEARPDSTDKPASKPDATAKPDTPATPEMSSKVDGPGKAEAPPPKAPGKDATERKSETATPPLSTDGASHRELLQRPPAAK